MIGKRTRTSPILPDFQGSSGFVLVITYGRIFAARCFENGMKPRTLRDLPGRASLDMTMGLYAHVAPEQKRQEVDKIAAISSASNGV